MSDSDIKYTAFISYRHSEKDFAVAKDVQNQLEHLKIPKDIKKKYGVKSSFSIFRDQDELPVIHDISGTIQDALRNSEWLIVICSNTTAESRWVQREIEYYLQFHPIEHVLTVLVDGEPENTIPEILFHHGMNQNISALSDFEPNSCDYRVGFRKAHKTEIPKLASRIIGCSYAELMQRQKQYLYRRIAVASAGITLVSLIAVGYLIYSQNQIHKHLQQTQISQSRYLAAESLESLDNHDRITALQLPLEALPDEGNERPLIPEAMYAAEEALHTYLTPGNDNIGSVWKYNMDDEIEQAELYAKPGIKLLAAIDEKENIKLWNLNSREEIFSFFDPELQSMYFLENGELLFWNLETIWKYDQEEGMKELYSCGRYELIYPTCGSKYVVVSSDTELLLIDPDSGQIKSVLQKEEYGIPETLRNAVLSDDGKYFCYGTEDYHSYNIYLLDWETEKLETVQEQQRFIYGLSFAGDKLFVMTNSELDAEVSELFVGNYMLRDSDYFIEIFSLEDLHLINSLHTSNNTVMAPADVTYSDECSYISLASGREEYLFDKETGELLKTIRWHDEIAGKFGLVDDDMIMRIMKDGTLTKYSFSKNMETYKNADFPENCSFTEIYSNNQTDGIEFAAVPEDSQSVYIFQYDVYDDEYTDFLTLDDNYYSEKGMTDHYLYFISRGNFLKEETDNYSVEFIDPNTKEKSIQELPEEYSDYSISFLGTYKDNIVLHCNSLHKKEIIVIKAEDPDIDYYQLYGNSAVLVNDHVYSDATDNDGDRVLFSINLETVKYEKIWKLPEIVAESYLQGLYMADENDDCVLMCFDNVYMMFHSSKGEDGFQIIKENDTRDTSSLIVVGNDGETVGIIGGKTVEILHPGKESLTFEHHEGVVYQACIKDNILYMIDSHYVLTQWDITSGTKINETEKVYILSNDHSQWIFTEDMIYLKNRVYFYILERSTGKIYTAVPDIIGLDSTKDIFYVLSEDNHIMTFDHYDRNDVVRKLKKALVGVEYDELLKRKYSLSE